ncbi:MAG: hypothetical protein M1833_006243 [Piccolia ochrophora]|nr:MAG: hypothetical protein M1833_006243 [Piccolia ochrophora]
MIFAQSLRQSRTTLVVLLILLCSLVTPTFQGVIEATDEDGRLVFLDDVRQPALFTGKYGDCLGDGNSIINVTRFDAAYYKDNMTVIFHLQGSTNVKNESLMLQIGVYAYGESRFNILFNPCLANVESMCPMKRNIPIEANGVIPIAPIDVAGIPPIALQIPDFEGQAILRIFANSTESEIGCYSAVVTNGHTFSQPAAVGTILGLFTFVAVVASFATAVYGEDLRTIRKHYAHSLSVFVVFAVYHHIFYTGALSMNWPSVLTAFWSNYAWAGGMIYSQNMQNSINKFIGSNLGNTSAVGAAGSGSPAKGLGGGYELAKIYKRAADYVIPEDAAEELKETLRTRSLEKQLVKRLGIINATEGYIYYGEPVKPGMPLPGNFSGMAGTLSAESIPASNAFMTGLLWLLILLVIIVAAIAALKWTLEGLSTTRVIKADRLSLFRSNWLTFIALTVLRTLMIAFFMMIFLTLFQFTYMGSAGVTAIAVIVFVLFFVGMASVVAYACYYRLRFGRYESEPDRLYFQRRRVLKFIPWFGTYRESQKDEKFTQRIFAGSIPWWRIHYVDNDPERPTVHEDAEYIRKFGWLSARFRRTRWWFFAAWMFYEFARACFFGGAAGYPMIQVFGLLAVEIIALVAIVKLRPFEGARLNVIMVYLLGFSKVSTVALSAAFATRFNMPRIITAAIGIVMVVIQGVLTIALMVAIVIGAISSYMSLTRNREVFRPRKWAPIRQKYFKHIDKVSADVPPPPPAEPQAPSQPYFNVSSVRRQPKIEDEDDDFLAEINDPSASRISLARMSVRGSRRNSLGRDSVMSHTTLPFGARVHRASWSTRDFENYQDEESPRNSELLRNSTNLVSVTPPIAAGPSTSTTSLNARVPSPMAGQRIHSSEQRLGTPLS